MRGKRERTLSRAGVFTARGLLGASGFPVTARLGGNSPGRLAPRWILLAEVSSGGAGRPEL
jgi:hypothetical protein